MPRVVARAKRGEVSSHGNVVYLIDDVHVVQYSMSGGLPVNLTTQYLKVLPNADRFTTDRPVVLTQGTDVVTGDAMAVDGKKQTLQLSGSVKGTYETNH